MKNILSILFTLAFAATPAAASEQVEEPPKRGSQASPEQPPAPPAEDILEAPEEDILEAPEEDILEAPEEDILEAPEEDGVIYDLPEIIVPWTPEQVFKLGGSAQLVNEKTLKELGYTNPETVLLTVPGVQIRQEDAFGLRPNIGLRGTSSERSKKVTLMEDGVLLAPAPYAAPAAYYFPLLPRVTGVEVFKGPSSILYGPHTVGGAINMTTRAIPRDFTISGDVGWGSYGYQKLHAHGGMSFKHGGFLVEAVHLGSSGFKEIDGGGDTGFGRQEVVISGKLHTALEGDVYQELKVKSGLNHDDGDETYLGLTDEDFRANPYRRYAASALDHIDLIRTQVALTHDLAVGESFGLKTTLYRHDMARTWAKIASFSNDALTLKEILDQPDSGQAEVFYGVLTGEYDSGSPAADYIVIGSNERTYISQGIQSLMKVHFGGKTFGAGITAGLRLHGDEIVRNHTKDLYAMEGNELIHQGQEPTVATRNRAAVVSLAANLGADVHLHDLTLSPGFRVEWIQRHLENRETGDIVEDDEVVPLFGVGAHYALTKNFGLLMGVHQGFSPVSPGQPEEVKAERSVSYEAGVRYGNSDTGTSGEVVAFFNDISNLSGECTFSASCLGSNLDRQFNGGAAEVVGLEVLGTHSFRLGSALELPIKLSGAWTQATFNTSFQAEGNPQWDKVEAGDHLPYVPTWQATGEVGVKGKQWGVKATATLLDSMREIAGQGEPGESEATDRAFMVDAMVHWDALDQVSLYLRGENLLDERPIVSRRPYGARPGKPLMVMVGARSTF